MTSGRHLLTEPIITISIVSEDSEVTVRAQLACVIGNTMCFLERPLNYHGMRLFVVQVLADLLTQYSKAVQP
jgi:hypothetical protein